MYIEKQIGSDMSRKFLTGPEVGLKLGVGDLFPDPDFVTKRQLNGLCDPAGLADYKDSQFVVEDDIRLESISDLLFAPPFNNTLYASGATVLTEYNPAYENNNTLILNDSFVEWNLGKNWNIYHDLKIEFDLYILDVNANGNNWFYMLANNYPLSQSGFLFPHRFSHFALEESGNPTLTMTQSESGYVLNKWLHIVVELDLIHKIKKLTIDHFSKSGVLNKMPDGTSVILGNYSLHDNDYVKAKYKNLVISGR